MRTTITLRDGSTLKVGDPCRFASAAFGDCRYRHGRVLQILQGTGVERAIITWNRDGSRHVVSRYGLRTLALALVAMLIAVSCNSDDEPYIDPDARGMLCIPTNPDCPDGGPDDGDADADGDAGTLPEGAECDVRLAECSTGLTCRLGPELPMGYCRPHGDAPIGTECQAQADPDCGPQADCFYLGAAVPQECRIICDMENPAARCGVKTCVPLWAQTIGYCET